MFVKKVEKYEVTWADLHTDGKDDGVGDMNKVHVDFKAMLCDVTTITTGDKYYIFAGATYGDGAYVVVAQFITTAAPTSSKVLS